MQLEIGVKIKTARQNAGFSQEQVAEALGVSRQTISNWENDEAIPCQSKCKKGASAHTLDGAARVR